MAYILAEWICRFSPVIGASALLLIGLVAIVLWRGGTIDQIKIPSLFDVKLREPIVFTGSRPFLYSSLVALASACGLFAFQIVHGCQTCSGMPGQTAWIYAGQFDPSTQIYTHGPFVRPENPAVELQDVKEGTWVTLVESRKTMILDYDSTGLRRALDSPFRLDGKVNYTCKVLPVATRLYVAQAEVNGPSDDVQHLWLRVRESPPG